MIFLLRFVFLFCLSNVFVLSKSFGQTRLLAPSHGAYHGAYVDAGPYEDKVSYKNIVQFQILAGKGLVWVYFSDHWLKGEIRFPYENIEICRQAGVIPYIRMMPWSELVQNQADPIISMQKIISGYFDSPLRVWARAAKNSRMPIMIEFGPEVNGSWFPWNGKWNGGERLDGYGDKRWPDGPERFRDAFRRIVQIFRDEGASNVTWILHLDAAYWPRVSWNHAKYYYPGDNYIDWVGLSVFGRQLPQNDWIYFPRVLANFMKQVDDMTPKKPLLISEFGVIEDPRDGTRKARWITEALQSVSGGTFKRVKGVSYWNSPGWLSDNRANFRIDSSLESLRAYQAELKKEFWTDKPRLGN